MIFYILPTWLFWHFYEKLQIDLWIRWKSDWCFRTFRACRSEPLPALYYSRSLCCGFSINNPPKVRGWCFPPRHCTGTVSKIISRYFSRWEARFYLFSCNATKVVLRIPDHLLCQMITMSIVLVLADVYGPIASPGTSLTGIYSSSSSTPPLQQFRSVCIPYLPLPSFQSWTPTSRELTAVF